MIATCSVLALVTRWKCKTYLLLLIAAYYIVAGKKFTVKMCTHFDGVGHRQEASLNLNEVIKSHI